MEDAEQITKHAKQNSLRKNLNILCIDDDKLILDLIEAQLTAFEPTLHKCTSAEQAKKCLASMATKPDLILCDIMMPETIGYKFHEYLKSDSSLVKIPFIYVTALYSERDYRKGMLQGADGYLAKPFTQDELIQEMQHVMQRHQDYQTYSSEPIQEKSAYIKLLGGQNVRVNGVLERAPDRGAEQVIYYLILQGRDVHIKRTEVMTAIWESISQSGFRSVISRAKKWSESWANWTIDRTTISFSLKAHCKCDLYLLEDLLDKLTPPTPIVDAEHVKGQTVINQQGIRPEKIKEIVELYQGELLSSFPETWAGSRRTYLSEAVKAIYIDALDPTVLPRQYVRALKRIIDIDPDDFDLWEEYIKTLKTAGMEQEAERARGQLDQQQS